MRVVSETGSFELGDLEVGPTIGIIDYSRRVTDDFGVTTIVERGFSRRMSVKIAVPFEDADDVQRQLAALRATPATWIADDRFASLSVRGFFKNFEVDIATRPLSYCTLSVEGLTETDAFVDTGGDPAPVPQASSLRLLQPVTIDDGVLTSSTVPENDAPEWLATITYALGAHVVRGSAHRIYESAASGNLGDDPTAATGKWIDIGPTNRWAPFDQALGSATIVDGAIEMVLTPNVPTTALALLDTNAATVRVRTGNYDRTQTVNGGGKVFVSGPCRCGRYRGHRHAHSGGQ